MNQVFTFAYLFLLFTNCCLAQSTLLKIGIEGGGGIRYLHGNDVLASNHSTAFGYTFGIPTEFCFGQFFSVRSGISYDKKGSVMRGDFTDNTGNSIGEFFAYTNLHYIIVPVFAKVSIGESVAFFMNTGPFFGYLVRAMNHSSAFLNYPEIRSDIRMSFNYIDIGYSLGMGLSIKSFKRSELVFEFRYNEGLSNISAYPVIDDGSIETGTANLLVSYLHHFGKKEDVD